MNERFDTLLTLYKEHVEMARQHETQRSALTSIILAIAGVLIGFAASFKFGQLWIIPIILICLGVFGAVFSRKHYERNRYHTSIAAKFRDEIDNSIGDIRKRGAIKHYIKYRGGDPDKENIKDEEEARKRSSLIAKMPLHKFWEGLNLVVAVAGVALLVLMASQQPEQPTKIEIVQPK
jgi:hypothetical protein